ncbi:universal stress protein [Halocatena salina]|uniref:universal stress protein n=1 Tax=Halocatena salina TaxID=2934340 RepID=UPI002493DAE8|nr:universal stress protein [Halocatena salina]
MVRRSRTRCQSRYHHSQRDSYGSPTKQIVKCTEDHVILGRHNKDPLSCVLLGRVSETVVRRASVVVTVVS